jgi:hypothetical protein
VLSLGQKHEEEHPFGIALALIAGIVGLAFLRLLR